MWQDRSYSGYGGFGSGLTRAVRVILVAAIGAFLLQKLVDYRTHGGFTHTFGLSARPLLAGEVWRLGTYLFLHGSLWHLLLNMLMLVFFGRELEAAVGTRRFAALYAVSGVLAGVGWVLISGGGRSWCIGASGAVFGAMGAFAALFPNRRLTLLVFFVLPVTMSARMMAVGMGLIELLWLFGDDGNIAHAAHLAGGVAGYLYGRRLAAQGFGGWRPAPGEPGLNEMCSEIGFRPWGGRRQALWRRAGRRLRTLVGAGGGHGLSVLPEPPSPAEIDRILEKITDKGLRSLTREERESLERASQR